MTSRFPSAWLWEPGGAAGQGILVGHSMGGLVVQKYLEQNPAQGAALMASFPPQGTLHGLARVSTGVPPRFCQGL